MKKIEKLEFQGLFDMGLSPEQIDVVLALEVKINELIDEVNTLRKKGEKCFCECHAIENFGWDQKTHSCSHCNPKTKGERFEEFFDRQSLENKNMINDYLYERVSQELAQQKKDLREKIEEIKLNPDKAKRWVVGSPEYREEKEYDRGLDDVIKLLEKG